MAHKHMPVEVAILRPFARDLLLALGFLVGTAALGLAIIATGTMVKIAAGHGVPADAALLCLACALAVGAAFSAALLLRRGYAT